MVLLQLVSRVGIAVLAAAIGLMVAGQSPSYAEAPANDNRPGTEITSFPYSESLNTDDATVEPDEYRADCTPILRNTVWWTFTPTERTSYSVDAQSDGFIPWFVVLTDDVAGRTQIYCSPDLDFLGGPQPTSSHLSFPGQAGVTYYVQLGGSTQFGGEDKGEVTLTISKTPNPPNDAVEDAQPVSLPFTAKASIIGATAPDDPQPSCLSESQSEVPANTVWYQYTPQNDGAIKVETSSYEGYDLLAMWSGTPDALTQIACGNPIGAYVRAGTTYFFQVGEGQYLPYPPVADEVTISIAGLAVPTCPAATQTIYDPLGDSTPGYGPPPLPPPTDIVSISAGQDSELACITVTFALEPAGPEDPVDFLGMAIYIDADRDGRTGEASFLLPCSPPIGIDLFSYITNMPNLFIFVEAWHSLTDRDFLGLGFKWRDGRSVTLGIPVQFLGGDQNFDVHVSASSNGGNDCTSEDNPITFGPLTKAAFGDVDCDNSITGMDALHDLLHIGRLADEYSGGCPRAGSPLPASYPADTATLLSGDVNCDGQIGAMDVLILLRAVGDVSAANFANCPAIGTPPLTP